MTRDEAIDTINDLYPTDCQYEDTNEIGVRLLDQAKRDINNWRNESTEILIRYAQLCIQEDSK